MGQQFLNWPMRIAVVALSPVWTVVMWCVLAVVLAVVVAAFIMAAVIMPFVFIQAGITGRLPVDEQKKGGA